MDGVALNLNAFRNIGLPLNAFIFGPIATATWNKPAGGAA
jgi:hypothetical protein